MRLLAVLFLMLFANVAYAIVISEVMHNPLGADSGKEWIEIYNNDNETYNLTGWKLNTDNTDHALNAPPANGGRGTMLILPGEYVIIAQNASNIVNTYTSYNGTIIDSSWQDLSNSANETILLKNSTTVFHNVTYSPAAEGNTACLISDSFQSCIPTPGALNSLPDETNQPPDQTQPPSQLCDLLLALKSSDVYSTSAVDFDLFVNDTNCSKKNVTIDYFIEDLSGRIVKPLINTTRELTCSLTIARHWTAGEIFGSEAYRIVANITNTGCNDTDVTNNNASKLIVVKGIEDDASPAKTASYVNIISVAGDNEIKYGESAKTKLEVYRGNTSKYAINVWVQDSNGTKLSEVSGAQANSKFTSYKFSVPVQMKPNCGGDFSDGTYTIVAEGLGVNSTKNIVIKGISAETCKIIYATKTAAGNATTNKTLPYEIISYPDYLRAGENFSVRLMVVNGENSEKNFSVYSYVYSGSTPVSLGFGDNWSGAWTANKKILTLMPNESAAISLESMIENSTLPGKYKLNIRIKNDRQYDFAKEVEILPALGAASGTAEAEKNATETRMSQIAKKGTTKFFFDAKAAARLLVLAIMKKFA